MNTNTTSVWRKKLKELEIVVVIPTYNNGKTLAAVIEEVYRYADDIIVINDGSTDDTANILEQYPAIRTITHPVMYLANLHTSFLCNLIYPTFSRILLYSC